MEVKELRQFAPSELEGRVRQWREDLFRSKFAAQTADKKDSSVFRKLRKDIARALTVMNEKKQGREFQVLTSSPVKEEKVETKKSATPKKRTKKVSKEE